MADGSNWLAGRLVERFIHYIIGGPDFDTYHQLARHPISMRIIACLEFVGIGKTEIYSSGSRSDSDAQRPRTHDDTLQSSPAVLTNTELTLALGALLMA